MHGEQHEALARRFADAYERHADGVYRFCRHKVRGEQEAEDLMQETFLRTWEYLLAGNEIEDLKTFLYRVASNMMIDANRTKKGDVSFERLQEQGFDPGEERMDHVQLRMDAQSALLSVEKKQEYKLLVMRYVHGLRPKDIADRTGLAPNTVAVRLHRAMKRLSSRYLPSVRSRIAPRPGRRGSRDVDPS